VADAVAELEQGRAAYATQAWLGAYEALSVSAVAADAATLLLDCFAPRGRGPLPRRASRTEVERAFPGWEITDVEIANSEPDALARLFRFDERFYRLRREG
jgi:hypothetical protein